MNIDFRSFLTLELIRNTMLSLYNNDYYGNTRFEEFNIMDWMFIVYIPNDYSFSISRELQEIVDDWVKIREDIFSSYNQLQFDDLKTIRYYKYDDRMGNYDWFVFLAVCVENNFIVDIIKTSCNEPSIVDIEPASPRLKVRIG